MSSSADHEVGHCPRQSEADTTYAELLQGGPIQRAELLGGVQAWVVTRFAEAKSALRDPRLIKDLRSFDRVSVDPAVRRCPEDVYAVMGRHVLNTDGKDHRRLRTLVTSRLSAATVSSWRPQVEDVVAEQLERLVTGTSGEADLVSDFARPVAGTVLARILGVPDDWMDAVLPVLAHLTSAADPSSLQMRAATGALLDLLLDAINQARPSAQRPGERTGLVSALVADCAQGRLTRSELISGLLALVVGGVSTTATLLAYGAALAIEHPVLARSLVSDEDSAHAVIEELLRYHPSTPFSTWRFAREDLELSGVPIKAGETVLIAIAAAHRDPLVYRDPDRLCPVRPQQPAHIAFGLGPHFCLGAPLARLEAQVALPRLFQRFPDLRLTVPLDDIRWTGVLVDRRPESIPVSIVPRSDRGAHA